MLGGILNFVELYASIFEWHQDFGTNCTGVRLIVTLLYSVETKPYEANIIPYHY